MILHRLANQLFTANLLRAVRRKTSLLHWSLLAVVPQCCLLLFYSFCLSC